jgi:parvulin-like peptidyl-prolyl isomerase
VANVLAHELGWDAITVTDAEIRAQYDSHPEQYRDPEKLRFQHIFFRAESAEMSPAERAKVRQRLENLRKEIVAGADFDSMAREYSQSSTATSGGWAMMKRGERAFGSFSQLAWSMKPEQLSPVIDTPNGFHLVKVKEKIPPLDRKFEDVKEFARQRAISEKLEAQQRAFVDETGKQFGLAKHYERLEDPLVKDDDVILEVGTNRLTMRQLTERLPLQLVEHLYNGYFPEIHRMLDKIAVEEVLALEARRRGLDKRPDVAEQVRTATDEIRSQAALDQKMKREVAALPEKELREFYTQNEQRYRTPQTWDLDVMLLKPRPGENAWALLKRGEDLVRRVRGGEDFAALARANSRHYSVRDGGRMTGLTSMDLAGKVQSTAVFRDFLSKLEPGDVGASIAECYDPERLTFVNTGTIVVRLLARHAPVPRPFEQVKDEVAANYLRRNYQRLETETKKAVLDSVAFRVHTARLPPL